MNYLAHAYGRLDHALGPLYLAGLALPDWLGVLRGRVKCRARTAAPWVNHADPHLAALAQGVMQHHEDDGWFHTTPAFVELSLQLAKTLREALADRTGMRPWFLGHVLLEMLLDAELMRREPTFVDRYYKKMRTIDASLVETATGQMIGSTAQGLAGLIERFIALRFLADYAEDAGLIFRLGQVAQRVGLEAVPPELAAWAPAMRAAVAARADELLTPPAV